MIPDLHKRIIAILGSLDHEEQLPGFSIDAENPGAIRIDDLSTSFPDDELDPYESCALAGGLFMMLWARWRARKLDPRIGSYQGRLHIAVFDWNQRDQDLCSFPVYRAESSLDLECLIIAAELELGLREGD